MRVDPTSQTQSCGKYGLRREDVYGLRHETTLSANLDLFFHAVPEAEPSLEARNALESMLEKAWKEDPFTCVKLIFHAGAAREGKQDRYFFYDALVWLWDKSPATVLANLEHVPATNYWKALLELVARIAEGRSKTLERRFVEHRAHVARRPFLLASDAACLHKKSRQATEILQRFRSDSQSSLSEFAANWATFVPPLCKFLLSRDCDICAEFGEPTSREAFAHSATCPRCRPCCRGWDGGSRMQHARRVLRKFDTDLLFRALYCRVAELFATQLRADLAAIGAPGWVLDC